MNTDLLRPARELPLNLPRAAYLTSARELHSLLHDDPDGAMIEEAFETFHDMILGTGHLPAGYEITAIATQARKDHSGPRERNLKVGS